MAEAEPTINITPLRPTDPTNAERSGATVQRSKGTVTRAVTPKVPRTVTPTVTPSRSIATVTLLAALALATCSATFSISGLTSIFAGAFWAVIGLGRCLRDRQAVRGRVAGAP
jgi:hypothetical protein